MQKQVLSPSVQDGDHTDLGSQVLRIGCDLEQRLRSGREQQIVKQAWVLQRQHIQFVRHSEHDMEIAGVEEFALPCCDPALASLRLTLGAVAIATRVVRDGLIPTTRASITMPAEGSGAATLNGTKGFELLKIKARSIPIQKAITVRAQNDRFLDRYRSSFDFQQLKAFRAIQRCRTAALGGHRDACPGCGYQTISYNSCRNRHCPKCQAQARERWITARQRELLDTSYFHVVFTVPHELNVLALENHACFTI